MFYGDKLLTAANPASRADLALLRALDLRPSTLPDAPASAVPQNLALAAEMH